MAEIKTYTPQGFKALQDELEYLETVRVEENKKEISTARSFGDLSENSEYDEAKNEQAKIEAQIADLEELLKNTIRDTAVRMYEGCASRTPSDQACQYCRMKGSCGVVCG